MFSVVIPFYNKAKYIDKAIHSVLTQTCQDFELIIINDGSTDGGLAKLMLLDDARIKIIDQQNAGVSITRNNGVKFSQYDYIAFLDADDWWHPDFLKEMRMLIHNFPLAALYGCSYEVVKNKTHRKHYNLLDDRFRGYINYFNVYADTFWVPINCSFVIVKKSIFNDLSGFNPQLKFGEDLDLWIRMALKQRVAYINTCLAYSNQDVEEFSRALGEAKRWQKNEHILFNLDYLENYEKESPELKRLLDGLRVRGLVSFYLTNQHFSAVKKILEVIDFKTQPYFYQFVYNWPKVLVTVYFKLKALGSSFKRFLLSN